MLSTNVSPFASRQLAIEVVKILQRVARELRSRTALDFSAQLDLRTKRFPHDLVTSFDTSVEARLRADLGALIPTAGFFAEESQDDVTESLVWVVDPIDGTTNFVHGLEYASISVALVTGGTPVIGVVHHLYRTEIYCGLRGGGAFLLTDPLVGWSRISASSVADTSRALASFGFPHDRANLKSFFQILDPVLNQIQDLRRQGSAALDICSVARGRMEAHFEPELMVWDIAAASLILQEAGGIVTDWYGRDLVMSHRKSISFLGTNHYLHSNFLALVRPKLRAL
jgi:myo-inositol-1(or 4)-monophosphatase